MSIDDISKSKLFFINDTYRKLIYNGRTYASYTKLELDTVFENYKNTREDILDPMSGYGGIMNYCYNKNISTYCLELNKPAYYWQLLTNPNNSDLVNKYIRSILENFNKLPRTTSTIVASDEWYSTEGKELVFKLIKFIQEVTNDNSEEIALSIALPFISRFSTCISGDVAHIKKGGITVFKNWKIDFKDYLDILQSKRINNQKNNCRSNHVVKLGDARLFNYNRKFKTVITSPPFPNYRDYYKFFAPENFILSQIKNEENANDIIGSNIVKNKKNGTIESKSAIKFLNRLSEFKGTKKVENDIKVYYIPYFANYFYDLELVCRNTLVHLEDNAECYFVVVNNATRNLIVPVVEAIEDFFLNHGFKSIRLYDSEVFHIGTVNPKSRGFKAKHTKYILKLWR